MKNVRGNILDSPYKRWGLFLGIIIIFIVLSLTLLTKDPIVFPDEVSFSNTAYWLLNRDDFGKNPFDNRLTLIEETTLTQYGPLYYVGLSLPLKIFGYSIYTVRLFSVLVGILTLFIFYLLVKKTTKSNALSLLATFLLAIDLNFLRSARFGRMEILVIFFNLLAYLFYLKIYEKRSSKDYLLLGGLLSLGLFTHFLNGLTPLIVIPIHLLLTKRLSLFKNKQIFLLVIPLTLLAIWSFLVFILAPSSAISESKLLIFKSLIPSLHSTKLILHDRITFNQINFLIYFLGFFILLSAPKRDDYKKFWLLSGSVTLLIVLWGNSFFYLSFIPIYFLPILLIAIDEIIHRKGSLHYLWSIPILFFIILSLFQQIILIEYSINYSYENFGQKISKCISKDHAKVYLGQLTPDPYFYLVSHRPDLKLFYHKFQDAEKYYLKEFLPKADYVINYELYEQTISSPEYSNHQGDSQMRVQLNDFIKNRLGLDPDVAQLLYEKKEGVCLIPRSEYHTGMAVFEL